MKINIFKIKYHFLVPSLILLLLPQLLLGDGTKWIAVGSLQSWYSSAGSEIEVGRTHLVSDQQDGLRWPAEYKYQDTEAAKALWIGATNYNDLRASKTLNYKVVHVGPRVLDEETEFMPQEFKLIGRFDHPRVFVDGLPAGRLDFMDFVDEVDENLPSDRMIYNVVNTGMGVTMIRKIYGYSQVNNNNYFIYDYTFKNTGIIDKKGTVNKQTLTGVVFFFQYRYAPTREGGPYGFNWLPQSTSWGHSTMNDVIYELEGKPFRTEFTWLGLHSKAGYDNIGGPNVGSAAIAADGHLGAAQIVGNITLHADVDALDKSDDPSQPSTTKALGSDDPISYNNDQFNEGKMAAEYAAMTAGRPAESQAQLVGNQFADLYGNTSGGFSQTEGFGPYTLTPGDSIHIVIAEGVAGINRKLVYEIGANWLNGQGPFVLPDGNTTNDKDQYKDAWVFTGKDSLFQTFQRAQKVFENNFKLPMAPPPPDQFDINSGGNRIELKWSSNAESWSNFKGYRIYRAIHVPDTTYEMIFETTKENLVHKFDDTQLQRGFDYYYYIVSFDDGTQNDVYPGVPLESSKFYTMTNDPAFLKRPPGETLADIRVVPNPYNIKARELQFGYSAPDRIMFLDIPGECTIKIYTERGDLIKTIEHTDGSGDEAWNSVTEYRQVVVSGIYIAVFITPDGKQAIRKFVIIR